MLTQPVSSSSSSSSSTLNSNATTSQSPSKLDIWGVLSTTLPSASSSSSSSSPPPSYKLRLLNVIIRHGENIPDEHDMMVIPRLSCKTRTQDWGELTKTGKVGAYEFGRYLREKYGDFVGLNYTHGTVRALSSDFDRTKLALELVLAGLYPHSDLWQPIPTGYAMRNVDNIFLGEECLDFQKRYDRLSRRASTRRKFAPYRNLAQKLGNIIGTAVTDQRNMAEVYHALMALNSTDRSLPVWTRGIFPRGQLYDATLLHYDIITHDRTLRKLFGGPLLRQITENMLNRISGVAMQPRIFLYSGHANNLIGLLSSLNLYQPHIPDFSSGIIVELLENNDKHFYVKVGTSDDNDLSLRSTPSFFLPHLDIVSQQGQGSANARVTWLQRNLSHRTFATCDRQ